MLYTIAFGFETDVTTKTIRDYISSNRINTVFTGSKVAPIIEGQPILNSYIQTIIKLDKFGFYLVFYCNEAYASKKSKKSFIKNALKYKNTIYDIYEHVNKIA